MGFRGSVCTGLRPVLGEEYWAPVWERWPVEEGLDGHSTVTDGESKEVVRVSRVRWGV